jgi:hypothetical protein
LKNTDPAGVDVQDGRFEIEVVRWRQDSRRHPEESWGVVDEVIYGNLAKEQVWLELDEWLKGEFVNEDGRRLLLGAVCIDSGGHHTQEVYRFCNTRIGRHIYAIKGMDGPRPIWPRRAGKSRKLSRLERLDDRRRHRQGRHLCEAQSDHARAGLLPFLDRLSAGIFQPAKRSGRASCAAIPCATGSNRRAKGTRPSTAVCTRSPRCTRARFRGRSSSAPRRPNHRRGRHHRPRAAVLPRPLRHHQCPRRQSRFERRRIRFRMK